MGTRTSTRLIAIVLLVVSGCTAVAETAAYVVPIAAGPDITAMGVGITGRTDITEEGWLDIATRACNEGAWDWDVANRIAEEAIGDPHPDADPQSGATAVWLILTVACHELIPSEAVELGPPG